MFSFDLQPNGTYKVHLLDGSYIEGIPHDTPSLRIELAKLSLRIEAREFVIHHELYQKDWWHRLKELSSQDIENLSEVYSTIYPYQEQWLLLDTYDDSLNESLSKLERDILNHKSIIDALKKELDEKKRVQDSPS